MGDHHQPLAGQATQHRHNRHSIDARVQKIVSDSSTSSKTFFRSSRLVSQGAFWLGQFTSGGSSSVGPLPEAL